VPHDGAVYTVAGSSGHTSSWDDRSTERVNPHPHPVMVASLRYL
jgi:hypothetical protein